MYMGKQYKNEAGNKASPAGRIRQDRKQPDDKGKLSDHCQTDGNPRSGKFAGPQPQAEDQRGKTDIARKRTGHSALFGRRSVTGKERVCKKSRIFRGSVQHPSGAASEKNDVTKEVCPYAAKVAKPAVHFGGKYRIIDFPLSNCANSGIDIVGVLTQYESVLLGTYVGAGTKWGLDGANSLAAILPARERDEVGATWYAGTADAIYQNLDFLDRYDPEYVLILSGDGADMDA